jgi:hypothetical protein
MKSFKIEDGGPREKQKIKIFQFFVQFFLALVHLCFLKKKEAPDG